MGIGNRIGCLLGIKSSLSKNDLTSMTILRGLSFNPKSKIRDQVAKLLARKLGRYNPFSHSVSLPKPTQRDIDIICGADGQGGFNRSVIVAALIGNGYHEYALQRILQHLGTLTAPECEFLRHSGSISVLASVGKSPQASDESVYVAIINLLQDPDRGDKEHADFNEAVEVIKAKNENFLKDIPLQLLVQLCCYFIKAGLRYRDAVAEKIIIAAKYHNHALGTLLRGGIPPYPHDRPSKEEAISLLKALKIYERYNIMSALGYRDLDSDT